MPIRHAQCCCGRLRVETEGEAVRVSVCHCLECQKRTGSAFGYQARWPRGQVKLEGKATKYTRAGDSGGKADLYFCPICGSTVYWIPQSQPDIVYVAAGAFADPTFPPPKISVYEERKHKWFDFAPSAPMEHMD